MEFPKFWGTLKNLGPIPEVPHGLPSQRSWAKYSTVHVLINDNYFFASIYGYTNNTITIYLKKYRLLLLNN